MALAPHLVRIPAVVPNHLGAFVRDVLSDGRKEVRSRKNLEVAVDLRVQLGAVNDRVARGLNRHFFNRKRIAQNVLGKLGEEALVFRPYGFATVYVKPRVFPRIEQFDAVCFEKIQFDQKLNDTGTEDFLQWFEGQLRQGMKNTIAGEQAVGNQSVDVRMKVQVLAKGMEGQDDCRVRFLIFQSSAQVNGKAFVSGCAEVFEQNTMSLKIGAQHFWQS